jgi:peptide subunit release factor RF-3
MKSTTTDQRSWNRTHFEVSRALFDEVNKEDELEIADATRLVCMMEGIEGIYDTAEDLTEKFEQEHRSEPYDREIYDQVNAFLKERGYIQ